MSAEISPISDSENSVRSEKSESSSRTLKNEIIMSKNEEKSSNSSNLSEKSENLSEKSIKNLSKTTVTDLHPLMSPTEPNFHQNLTENTNNESPLENFKPQAHSSMLKLVSKNSSKTLENFDENLSNLNQLPDFPESPTLMKKSQLYDMPLEISPTQDLSDTENEKSIYEAILSPNLQNVSLTMNEKVGNLNFLSQVSRSNKLRKIKVVPTSEQQDQDSDVSSIESISESIKSEDVFQEKKHLGVDMDFIKELLDSPDDMEDSILDGPDLDFLPNLSLNTENGDQNSTPEPIKEYSLEEERRDSRFWQKIELPNGKIKIIDMRVIEPYKRVLSHGGYLQAGGHNAIILFSACFLPDKSRKDYVYVMDNLFLYVLQTLDQLVTEDYVLVYLHGSASSHCMPTIGWLKRCYQLIDRKLRKNLKHLYIVHPTFWLKTIIMMTKPFISAKFYRKIHFINSIQELTNCLPLETAAIPERVINYDKLKFST